MADNTENEVTRREPTAGAVSEANVTPCRYCRQPIARYASVCHHCHRHQKRFWQHFRFEQIGLLASVTMVIIAFWQLREARMERIQAGQALADAQTALAIADSARVVAEDLQAVTEFHKVLVAAGADDRRAFERLDAYARDLSSGRWRVAANAQKQILLSFRGVDPAYVTLPAEVELEKMSLAHIREVYRSAAVIHHADIVNRVWRRTDMNERKKIGFLIDVLRDDPSLIATYYAGKFVAGNAAMTWQPFEVQPLLEWWDSTSVEKE